MTEAPRIKYVRKSAPKHWKQQEIDFLRANFRKLSDTELALKLNKTPLAIRVRRIKLKLNRRDGVMGISLKAAIAQTGYSDVQLLRARDALGMTWRRVKPSYNDHTFRESGSVMFRITDEQIEKLVEYLKNEWGPSRMRLPGCIKHGGKDRPHQARGMCANCYAQEQSKARRGLPSLLDTAPVHTPSKAVYGLAKAS